MTSMMLMASFLASAAMISAAETFEQHSHSRVTLRLNSTTLHCSGQWFEVWPTPAHVVVSAMLRLEVVSNVSDQEGYRTHADREALHVTRLQCSTQSLAWQGAQASCKCHAKALLASLGGDIETLALAMMDREP